MRRRRAAPASPRRVYFPPKIAFSFCDKSHSSRLGFCPRPQVSLLINDIGYTKCWMTASWADKTALNIQGNPTRRPGWRIKVAPRGQGFDDRQQSQPACLGPGSVCHLKLATIAYIASRPISDPMLLALVQSPHKQPGHQLYRSITRQKWCPNSPQ